MSQNGPPQPPSPKASPLKHSHPPSFRRKPETTPPSPPPTVLWPPTNSKLPHPTPRHSGESPETTSPPRQQSPQPPSLRPTHRHSGESRNPRTPHRQQPPQPPSLHRTPRHSGESRKPRPPRRHPNYRRANANTPTVIPPQPGNHATPATRNPIPHPSAPSALKSKKLRIILRSHQRAYDVK